MALKFLPLWMLISLCTLRIFLFLDNDMQDMICDENDPLPINTPSLKKSSKGCPWHNEAGLHLPWPINFHLNWWFYSWASRFTSHHKQSSRPSTQNRYLEDRAIDFLFEILNNEKLGKDSCWMPVVRRPLCAHPQTAWFPSKANLNFGKNIRLSF